MEIIKDNVTSVKNVLESRALLSDPEARIGKFIGISTLSRGSVLLNSLSAMHDGALQCNHRASRKCAHAIRVLYKGFVHKCLKLRCAQCYNI